MSDLMIQISKYVIVLVLFLYTVSSYTIFRKSIAARKRLYLRQNVLMLAMHAAAFASLYLETRNEKMIYFYEEQVAYFLITLVLFRLFYKKANQLIINHMCMLISIGFIMITRLDYDLAEKQFKIAVASTVIALMIPVIIRKLRLIMKLGWLYAFMGIGLLILVVLIATVTNGAKLSLSFGGISIQPSEFVKIIFVFCMAGLLYKDITLKKIVIATALAALHVLILVASTDLGSALIFFVAYTVIIYTASGKLRYPLAALAGLAGASVVAYHIFSHIRVRVQIWRNPFADYTGSGYQICQSLFSYAAGKWFGLGLYQGAPRTIPFVQEDFIFSAIAEEMGTICCILIILICMSCFIMFINVATGMVKQFYRLVAVGLASIYAFQIFLTIGGGMKMVPLTGVTLPLISYGGSSMLSSIIMFSIIQGLYLVKKDEDRQIEEEGYESVLQSTGEGGFEEDDYETYESEEYEPRDFDPDDYEPEEIDPDDEEFEEDGFEYEEEYRGKRRDDRTRVYRR